MSITTGVYILYNRASNTVLDLSNGNAGNGTRCQGWQAAPNIDTFNQQWLITPVGGLKNHYTFRNLRGGTYLDLSNGSRNNGTQVQGWSKAVPQAVQNQQWEVVAEGSFYRLRNRASGSSLDLSNGFSGNGTKVQCWSHADVPAQHWMFRCVSRSGHQIGDLVKANQYIGSNFQSYVQDWIYIVLPSSVRNDIYSRTGLRTTPWRSEIFDCDDFSFVVKAAVAKWGNDYLRADDIAIVFGIMFGANSQGVAHAYNWYPMGNFDNIIFFEPQNGNEMVDPGYKGYFAVY